MLRLEAEVSLHEDEEWRLLKLWHGAAEVVDMGADEGEVALGLCQKKPRVILVLKSCCCHHTFAAAEGFDSYNLRKKIWSFSSSSSLLLL